MPFRGQQSNRHFWRLLVAMAFVPSFAMGQSVRGKVTERATSAPALGAIVTLERVNVDGQSRREVRSVLVDEQGAFEVGATSGGLYTIFVRRIATRPFRSDTMRLAGGDVRRLDVSLDAIKLDGSVGFMLDRVTVTSATPCLTSQNEATRIASLWENTRTALLSTAIATRDSLVKRRLIRYERSLDPATFAIQREDVRFFDAYAGSEGGFFRSISGDSLSRAGYWQRTGTGAARFHGPDENALLSSAFLSDHCFTLDESDGDGHGLIGLGFEPADHRRSDDTPPEIRGTIWADASTSELRMLEFTWLTFPHGVPAMRVGGRVEYARLTSGPWFVRRWWLRMPEGLPSDRGTPAGRFGILEEGGLVQTGARGRRWGGAGGAHRDHQGRCIAAAGGCRHFDCEHVAAHGKRREGTFQHRQRAGRAPVDRSRASALRGAGRTRCGAGRPPRRGVASRARARRAL